MGQGKVISVVQVCIVMIGLGVACMQDRSVLQNLALRFVCSAGVKQNDRCG